MGAKGKINIKRDDQIMVMTGKERGKSGKVLKVERDKDRIIVQSLNMVKKAVKPKRQDEKGGIIEVEAPIHVSNVQIMCKKCGPTRIGHKMENDKKIRICRKCGEAL